MNPADDLERQAGFCAQMGSPLYGALLAASARDARYGGPVAAFFAADETRATRSLTGIRLMGAVHRCALDGSAPRVAAHFPSCGGDGDAAAAWLAVRECIEQRSQRIGELFEATPQTNEVARSMLLLGGALQVAARTALPIRLLDAGASAGLNARFDCYAYRGEGWSWGDLTSPLLLENSTASGRPAHLDAPLRVESRAACDLHPIDAGTEDGRLSLRSFVWADQLERFERLNRAIAAASRVPLAVEACDMLEWIPRTFVPERGRATVLVHTVVAEHLPATVRDALEATIRACANDATASAPLAWLRLEASDTAYETRLTLWPGGHETLVARSDGHAQSIEWIVAP